MTRSFGRLLTRAFVLLSAGVLVLLGGLTATAHAQGNGSGGGSNAGPPSDAAQARSASATGVGSSAASNNRGHIQIEGVPDCGGTACGNDNDPHVGCTLTVQFFGYPSGTDSAGVVIAGQAPSGSGRVLTDSFHFSGNSNAGTPPYGSHLDYSKTYSITVTQLGSAGLKSQPQQGYHLRIDVSVNGEPAKSKVVWYGCPSTAGSGVTPAVTTQPQKLVGGDTPTVPTTVATSSRSAAVIAALPDTPAGKPSGVLTDTPATLAKAAAAKPAGGSSGFLAFTGWDALLALAVAAVAVGAGTWMVKVSRRRRLA
jgi:hypothetical protein